jgi:hypothetical protein
MNIPSQNPASTRGRTSLLSAHFTNCAAKSRTSSSRSLAQRRRHTAGAIVTLFVLIYLPLILLTLPSPWNTRIDRFTATIAAYQAVSAHPHPGLLSPALSLLVLIAWPAAALLTAAILISRRDA